MAQRPSSPEELAQWTEVDRYLEGVVGASDPALEATLRATRDAGMPEIQVAPLQGKMLHLLARAVGARRILEIGLLGGYSTTWLARALPPDGRLVSLELSERHAAVAKANLARAGVADRVEIRVGPALASLVALAAEGGPPFDLAFIDAEKREYPEYLAAAVDLLRPGGVIVADNVVRRGDITDRASADPSVVGVRKMYDDLRRNRRITATVVQTVGAKGYDGFLLAVVGPPARSGAPSRPGRRSPPAES
ncbi:MAG TPA: O-methyltransferase [Thermoplasmata archaeon]|nr:O-methyltransferase [Thermoplasmata archaeon]